MLLSEKKAKMALHVIIPVVIAIVSFCLLANRIPETKFIGNSLESVEGSKETVMEFTAATLATSVAISALPDDFGSPLADSLAGMNKYFVFLLIVIFVERLILIEGTKIAFMFLIPGACAIYLIGYLLKKQLIQSLSYRIATFALALVLVIPCSINFTNMLGADYLNYVDETIEATKLGAEKINNEMAETNEDQTIFERLSDAFKTAIQGVTDLVTYFRDVIKRCVNAIAILILTTFVLPIINLFVFRWILNMLFGYVIPLPSVNPLNYIKKSDSPQIEDTES